MNWGNVLLALEGEQEHSSQGWVVAKPLNAVVALPITQAIPTLSASQNPVSPVHLPHILHPVSPVHLPHRHVISSCLAACVVQGLLEEVSMRGLYRVAWAGGAAQGEVYYREESWGGQGRQGFQMGDWLVADLEAGHAEGRGLCFGGVSWALRKSRSQHKKHSLGRCGIQQRNLCGCEPTGCAHYAFAPVQESHAGSVWTRPCCIQQATWTSWTPRCIPYTWHDPEVHPIHFVGLTALTLFSRIPLAC